MIGNHRAICPPLITRTAYPPTPPTRPACFAIPSPSLQDGDAVFFVVSLPPPSRPSVHSEQCIIPKAEPERMDLSHFPFLKIISVYLTFTYQSGVGFLKQVGQGGELESVSKPERCLLGAASLVNGFGNHSVRRGRREEGREGGGRVQKMFLAAARFLENGSSESLVAPSTLFTCGEETQVYIWTGNYRSV